MSILNSMIPPQGLRVLVTAGGAGIGRTIADAFLEAGAHVHVCDTDATALAKDDSAATGTVADVSSEADVEQLMIDVRKNLGGLDVVVNNAGIAGPTAGLDVLEPEQWYKTIDVNVNGQYLVSRHTIALLRESRGALINMASVAGRLGFAFRTPYATSKWAVVGLTKSLAQELGPEGIRVNAILPGIVRGPRIESVIRNRAEALGISYGEMEKSNLEKVSLRRMVEAEDVAAMALFLCAPGGANISGQALSVCGNVESL